MDDPKLPEISEGLRAGRLEGISFPELLMALCRTGCTGTLCLAHRGGRKNLYFENGRVIFAASDNPDDRLGIQLLKQEAVTLHQLETAIKSERAGTRLGTLLVEADSITSEQLVRAVIDQVKAIVLDLFTVTEAEYRFTEGPLPTREVITLDLSMSALVLEGIKRTRSLHWIRQGIGGSTTVYGLAAAWEVALEGLELSEGERLLVNRLAQGAASLDQLCDEVFLSNFEICQFLLALRFMGAIEELGFRADLPGELPFRDAGEGQGFLEFLLQLSRSRETGVLYATLGARERSFHLRRGECVFATSNHPEDGLVNFLLRRGVISLRDREETSHRLLSNKRVGTILLELGVIDETDLRDMVRQQLVEVVYDTFRWDGGEFSFISGPLPSIEPITLEGSLESLVAAGLRRVTSWTRIRRGCGGLRSTLALTPEYLDVLDDMGAGVEEWEVVNALRTPRSPLEVCQLSQLGNFRVCQILWAMKTLGGIEVIQAERPEAWEDPSADLFTAAQPACAESTDSVQDEQQLEDSTVVAGDGTIAGGEDEAAPQVPDAGPPAAVPVRWYSIEGESETHAPRPLGDAAPGAGSAQVPEIALDAREEALTHIPIESDSNGFGQREVHLHAAPEAEAHFDPDDRDDGSTGRVEVRSAAPDLPEPEAGAGWTADPERRHETTLHRMAWPGVALDSPDSGPETGVHEPWEERFPTDAEASGPADESGAAAARRSAEELSWETDPEGAPAADSESADAPQFEFHVDSGPRRGRVQSVVDKPAWEPPADLDSSITRFNAMQRVIYRTVRSEVGAGAANFVRSCCEAAPQAEIVARTELHTDGSWDVEGLRNAVIDQRIEDPWFEYRRLINREIEILRGHIGEARAHELQLQVERAENGLPRID